MKEIFQKRTWLTRKTSLIFLPHIIHFIPQFNLQISIFLTGFWGFGVLGFWYGGL